MAGARAAREERTAPEVRVSSVKGGERLGLLRAAWSYCRAGCSGLLQRALGCSGPEVAFERIT